MEAGALHAPPAGLSRISIATPLLRLRSDEQLVALFRAGNEDAFQVIFDRYRQRLFAYTRQMLAGSKADAEDALQDVFLRAYAALRANDRPVSLRAWLYRVAHNRCIDQLRRPTPAHADVFDMQRSPMRDPLQETERREDLRRLVEDVQRLPEAQRSALLMREIDGLSYQELADALDVTVPAIKSLLVRARIGLVEAIEARDTACCEIRDDLLSAFDRGVRASGRARRHLRDCSGCRDYKTQLRTIQQGFGALTPSPGPLAVIAKLFGLGGAGGSAVAGGGAVIGGGGGAAVIGGGAAAATACKVAAIVCSAALVTTAADDLRSGRTAETAPAATATSDREPAGRAASAVVAPQRAGFNLPAAARAATAAGPGTAAAQPADVSRATATAAPAQPSAAVAASSTRPVIPVSPNDAHYGSSRAESAGAGAAAGTLPATDDPLVAGEAEPLPAEPAPTGTSGTTTPPTTPGTTTTTTTTSSTVTVSGSTATPVPGTGTTTSAPTANAASTSTPPAATGTGTAPGSTAPAPSSTTQP